MRKLVLLIVLVTLACAATGCLTQGSAIAASSRPLNPDSYTVLGSRGRSATWTFVLFGIPFTQASTATALDEAVAMGGGDALVQVTADNRYYFLGPVFLIRNEVQGLGVKVE